MSEEEDAEEAQCVRDQVEEREAPLSRFGVPEGDNYGKDKGDRNNGNGDGYGDRKAFGIPGYDLSLRVEDVHDPQVSRMELVSSMSPRKRNRLYGSIYAHLSRQGIWDVGLVSASLFGTQTRIRMNIIGITIINLWIWKAE